jgi:hypothetical protein
MLEKSLWNRNSPLSPIVDKIEALIPSSGSVDNPRKNRALEKFRKAANCYCDLYNNGLMNRASEFRTVFGIASTNYIIHTRLGRRYTEEMYAAIEIKMNEFIRAVVIEQGIN